VCDGGLPAPLCTNSKLTLNVDFNLHTPVITNPGASKNFVDSTTVLETKDFNYVVYTVTATDADITVNNLIVLFSIIGVKDHDDFLNL